MCQAIARTQVNFSSLLNTTCSIEHLENKMAITQLTDLQILEQSIKWLIRYNRKPRNTQRHHAEYVRSVDQYHQQHRMITRQQRMQLEVILWESNTKFKTKIKSHGNKKTTRTK